MITLTRCLSLAICLTLPALASAHEFWIEPGAYQVEPGEEITADLKNGENFSGINLSYIDRNIARFDIAMADEVAPVEGRMGDRPALKLSADRSGLIVVLHETTPSSLTYKTWDKFQTFADHKDFPDIRARHDARGLPEVDFKEDYTRHAKALIAVGDGAGSDQAFGLETELVALTNPYSPNFNGDMQVALFYNGAARPDAQVEVFERAPDDTVTVSLYRTDSGGKANIPVKPGHDYLFDAVVLRPAPDEADAVWETLWAALTFSVPE